MVTVETEVWINAPLERCFDLARNIDVHTRTVWPHTKERAVAGITTGPIGNGETVTFEATHLGVRQRLTSLITAYHAPYYFVDEMQRGAFKYLRHEHYFECAHGMTLMRDRLKFAAPLGVVGWLVERAVLRRYMYNFLKYRNEQLKVLAEAN
ncbi:ligand-binding SRPBCC domain-containing protein [Paenibacillus taihuensis]|uniref:Ligand-binding SRPBCC domain-containing protein n=1 Tax=Paenibacillus taihuensis TaxID=1156355 RepID=A0A3D9RX35_9BACL|nr:SRPBCC family protein [Paenibacillus taihuensis]REE84387.1 ligand-binding SRPBCC domain-containing protein [Paenibacillus taihuensis]